MMAEAMQRLAYRLAIAIMVPLILAAPFVVNVQMVEAADFTSRRLDLSDSNPAIAADHTLSFEYVTGANTGSLLIEYCATSPLFAVACVPPVGLDLTTGTLSSETGETGFSIDAASTANTYLLTRVPAVVTPQPASYLFTGVTNPDNPGSYYVRFSSYASVDASGARIDEGGLAWTVQDPVNFTTFVPPVLLFCLGTSIPTNSCSSATGDNIDFGDFSTASTAQGTTQMLAATNGVGGYNITISGTTMTSGNNVIPGLAAPAASAQGTSQFGINLRDNSVPNIGSNVSGVGAGSPRPDYNTPNQYKFVDGDVVASSAISTDINRFTTSYIVNISPDQKAGVYATTLTYIAFANF